MTACSCPLPWKSAICLQFDKTRLPLFRFRTMPSQNTIIKQWPLWAAYNKMIQRKQTLTTRSQRPIWKWFSSLRAFSPLSARENCPVGKKLRPCVKSICSPFKSGGKFTSMTHGKRHRPLQKLFDLSRRWQNVKSNQLWSPTSYDMSQLRRERRAHIQMLLLHNAMYILAHSYSSYTYSPAFIFIHTHSHTVYFDLQRVKLSFGSTRSYLLPTTTYKNKKVNLCITVCNSV